MFDKLSLKSLRPLGVLVIFVLAACAGTPSPTPVPPTPTPLPTPVAAESDGEGVSESETGTTSNLRTFIKRICVNRCIDEIRRQVREREVIVKIQPSNTETEPTCMCTPGDSRSRNVASSAVSRW